MDSLCLPVERVGMSRPTIFNKDPTPGTILDCLIQHVCEISSRGPAKAFPPRKHPVNNVVVGLLRPKGQSQISQTAVKVFPATRAKASWCVVATQLRAT